MIMRQIESEAPRSRGRPQIRPDEDTRRLILEAARHEFQTSGYAGACIGDVAQRAGVSTKTLYRLIPTKADLFKAVVTERITNFMADIDRALLDSGDTAQALERMLVAYGGLTLEAGTIALNRLVIGESERFPEIASTFYESAILRTERAMEGWLRGQCERGHIALEDPRIATEMLRGMMVMEPQRAAMLRMREAPDAEEIAKRARLCARLFLDGCKVKSASATH
jgi:AcrR family transcriptional regulator